MGIIGLVWVVVLALAAGAVVLSTRGRRQGANDPRQERPSYEAEAREWVERLGGSLSTLKAGGNLPARQALTDAEEHHEAARRQLATASDPADYTHVQRTAVEGLYYIRAARTALDLDPGPTLPDPGTGPVIATGGEVTVGAGFYTASARPGATTPYYHPGGVVDGRTVPGGWYSAPWWKTALVGTVAGVGGVLLADAALDGLYAHHA